MDSGQGLPPAQGQFFDSQQPAYQAPMQGEVQVAQYPPANIAPGQYPPNPSPMQYPPQQPGNYQYPYQPQPNPVQAAYNQPQVYIQPGYIIQSDGQFAFSSQASLCPTCREVVQTRTQRSPSAAAWISFVLLLLVFVFFWLLPLCCIPFCIPSCYNVKHFCPRCGGLLGERRP